MHNGKLLHEPNVVITEGQVVTYLQRFKDGVALCFYYVHARDPIGLMSGMECTYALEYPSETIEA